MPFGRRCRVLHPGEYYSWRCATAEANRIAAAKLNMHVKVSDAHAIVLAVAAIAMLRQGRATVLFGPR